MNKWIAILAACLGTLVPGQAFCQYQSTVYDIDSTADFGENIFLNKDGSMFLYGGCAILPTYRQEVGWFTLSSNGTQKINQHILGYGNDTILNYPSQFGDFARLKRLPDSSFTGPLTVFNYNVAGQPKARQGMLHLDKTGNVLFSRTYSDTSYQYDFAYDVTELPDGGYVLAGRRLGTDNITEDSATLIRTDSTGNMLWQRTYKPYVQLGSGFLSVQYIDSGKLLLGGYITGVGSDLNYIFRPWFVLMDTAGNILHQKYYPHGHREGGNIFKDKNGGYFHWGATEDVFVHTPGMSGIEQDYRDYPGYLAHLDDSFNFQWTYRFIDNDTVPNYNVLQSNIKQLADSGYLVLAQQQDTSHGASYPRVIKLDKYGHSVWQQNFIYDTVYYDVYLMDAVEKPDGSLLLLGSNKAYNGPAWRDYDFWLLGIDSNGCASSGCTPLATAIQPPPVIAGNKLKVYPNPVSGTLQLDYQINTQGLLTFTLTDITGRTVLSQPLSGAIGHQSFTTSNLAAGMYLYRLTASGLPLAQGKLIKQ